MAPIYHFLVYAVALCSLAEAGKRDAIERASDVKGFKKLLNSRMNVLVAFTAKSKIPPDTYKVLSEVADVARGIGTVAHVHCDGDGAKLCKKRKANPRPGDVILQHYSEGNYKKDYDRAMSVKSMLRFLHDPEGDTPWDEEPGAEDVVHIETPRAFDKLVQKSGLPLLVMFYAPWCGHCKRLKPDFAAAAAEAKSEAVLVGVDCVKPELDSLKQRYEITGFPTLLYFKKGKLAFKYGGAQTKDGILEWLENPAPPKEPEKEPEWSEEESDVVHLTEATFKEAITENPSVLVMFYAPWCGHCKAMKPDYTLAAAMLKEEGVVGVLAAVDATKNQKLAEEFEVKGFPTVKYFSNGTLQYDANVRTKDGIVSFMKDPQEEVAPPPSPEEAGWNAETSNVVHLEDANFKSFLKKKKHALVMFYAPWCGHCKSAKPHFSASADSFADNIKVAFAGVDCTVHQATCSEHDVKGYPTFKYFNYGKETQQYRGGREEADFTKFMTDPSAKQSASPASGGPPKNVFEGIDGEEHVVQLTASSIHQHIEESQSSIILYYAPWCGHCKRMLPDYVAAAKELNEAGHPAALAAIDVTTENIGEEFGIKGFPTLKYYQNGKFHKEFTERSKTAIVEFIKDPNSTPAPPPVEDLWADVEGKENVAILDEATFDSFLSAHSSVLVMFYAPWCGHCKRMKVPFAQAGSQLKTQEVNGKLAAVDATQNRGLSEKFKVTGFPTLLYFQDGQQAVEYQSGREVKDIVSFMIMQIASSRGDGNQKKTEL